MKVLIFKSPEDATEAVAASLIGQVLDKPDASLGFATGGTAEPVYDLMVSAFEKGKVSFRKVRAFNLDEYIGLTPDHPMSYRCYMRRHLFDRTDFQPENTHIPKGDAQDPAVEAVRYEEEIDRSGGIDCQLLGIGENGHIGFNEPTSSLSSRTRVKTLARGTVEANSRFFDRIEDVPRLCITMGIATILGSRKCLLLATGKRKAGAVAKMIEGPLAAICPASALQMHSNAVICLDEAAAGELNLRAYYLDVHPDGKVAAL